MLLQHYIILNKKFNLSIKSPAILGNQNSISVDFEASTPGNVANEEKAITWKSSNPAIAEGASERSKQAEEDSVQYKGYMTGQGSEARFVRCRYVNQECV